MTEHFIKAIEGKFEPTDSMAEFLGKAIGMARELDSNLIEWEMGATSLDGVGFLIKFRMELTELPPKEAFNG